MSWEVPLPEDFTELLAALKYDLEQSDEVEY